MPYQREHAAKIQDPGKYEKVRRQNDKFGPGIDVMWGVKHSGASAEISEVQSIRFDKTKFSVDEAKAWLKNHDYKPLEFAPALEANMEREARFLIATPDATRRARTESIGGREYTILPMAMLVEGVHKGTYYPPDHIVASAPDWEGVPVTILHAYDGNGREITVQTPGILDKQGIGFVRSPAFVDGKLRAEACIDNAKAEALRPGYVAALAAGQEEELSTGLFLRPVKVPGQWNGERYNDIATDLEPDHLAFLPGKRGACSREDGCGVWANEARVREMEDAIMATNGEEGSTTKGTHGLRVRMLQKVASALGLRINEQSFSEIRMAVQAAVATLDSPGWSHWVRAVYKTWLVYDATPINPSPSVTPAPVQTSYRVNYTIDQNGVATLSGTPVAVREETQYIPVVNEGGGSETPVGLSAGSSEERKENADMEKKELIQTLIDCPCNKLTVNDVAELDKLPIAVLENMRMVEGVKAPEPAAPKTEPAVVVTNVAPVAPVAPATEPPTMEKWLEMAPPGVRSFGQNAVAEQARQKDTVIAALMANPGNRFTKDYLETQTIVVLQAMQDLSTPVAQPNRDGRPSFVGNGGGPAIVRGNDEEFPPVAQMWDLSAGNVGK